MQVPLCFWSSKQFELWRSANEHLRKGDRCEEVCADCLPTFQLRMNKQSRCEHPEVIVGIQ